MACIIDVWKRSVLRYTWTKEGQSKGKFRVWRNKKRSGYVDLFASWILWCNRGLEWRIVGKMFVGKRLWKRPFGWSKRRWENNSKGRLRYVRILLDENGPIARTVKLLYERCWPLWLRCYCSVKVYREHTVYGIATARKSQLCWSSITRTDSLLLCVWNLTCLQIGLPVSFQTFPPFHSSTYSLRIRGSNTETKLVVNNAGSADCDIWGFHRSAIKTALFWNVIPCSLVELIFRLIW